MKQIALSLFVIASSGGYVWDHAVKLPDNDLIDQGANAAEQTTLRPVTPLPPADPVAAPANLPVVPQFNGPREPAPRATVEAGKDTPAKIAAAIPQPPFADSQPEITQPPPPPPKVELPGANAATPQTPSFAVTPAVYIPIPQPRPNYPPARVIHTGMKLAAHGYADGVYTGPAADAYYGIIQIQALV